MKIKSGPAFHCHHDKLLEWCFDYDERVKFIKENKSPNERKLRLKLFKIIPPDKLPPDLIKAWAAHDKARTACDKLLIKHNDYLIKLHEKLCPNCPWDGKTIFP